MLGYATFDEIVDQVSKHTQELDTGALSRIRQAVNTGYDIAVRRADWPALVRARETGITTTSGDRFLYLPKDVAKVYFLVPSDIGDVIPHQTIYDLFTTISQFSTTPGSVYRYADAGESGTKASIATAEAITVFPGGSAENYNLRIHGRNGDDEIFENVTISNSTPASSTNTFEEIYAFVSGGEHTGIITLSGVSSSTEYATIGTNERTAKYKRLRVWSVPSSAESIAIFFQKRVQKLTNDDQVPEIPVAQYLVHYAIAQVYSRERKWQGAHITHLQQAEAILADIIAEDKMGSQRIEQGTPYPQQFSRGRTGYGTTSTIIVGGGG